ncbi:MAG: hypothetical protein U0452_09895 [Anaerolineae bacterium]
MATSDHNLDGRARQDASNPPSNAFQPIPIFQSPSNCAQRRRGPAGATPEWRPDRLPAGDQRWISAGKAFSSSTIARSDSSAFAHHASGRAHRGRADLPV